MKVIFAKEQKAHYPGKFLVNGVFQPNPEVPERADRLLEGALNAGCVPELPAQAGLEPIAAVHSEQYIRFLQSAWERWERITEAADAVTPNIHPDSRNCGYPQSVVAQAGFHMSDAACPVSGDTWESICWSAWTAAHAATIVAAGASCAYALCRPPGHHASKDIAGGFCYFNNSAITAELLRKSFERVAILDIDLHHGNGTQSIFYQRPDVMTVSIHADPSRFYPFFWGYENERGSSAGLGYNLNLPLPRGSADEAFLAALDTGIAQLQGFAPGALVVALGLDGFEGDPFGGLAISTDGFGRIGEAIARGLKMPTVCVQEGGYLCDQLGDNLTHFLQGLSATGGIR